MKKLLIAVAAVVATTVASFGQAATAQVVFGNLGGGVNAPVFLGTDTSTTTGKGPGPSYTAGLYMNGTLVPGATATFRAPGTGAQAIADRYWTTATVDVPGVTPGANATFVVRAWQTSLGSFDAAKATGVGFGESAPVTIAVGGGTLPPANLTGLTSFTVAVPEPTTIALGLLGAAALLLRRRK